MTMLAVQSLLLIMAAFFAGAMIACFVRRVFFVRDDERPTPDGGRNTTQKKEDVVETKTTTTETTTTVSSQEAKRFGRALTGSAMSSGVVVPSTQETPTDPAANVLDGAANAPDLATSAASTQPSTPAISQVGGDDLTRIRSIDRALAQRLHDAGVTTFAQIAAWQPGDVARLNQTLGFVGRVEKENWIEQAKIIDQGSDAKQSTGQTGSAHESDLALTKGSVDVAKSASLTASSTAKPASRASGTPPAATADAQRAEAQSIQPVRSANVSALRSVRSEALVGVDPTGHENVVTFQPRGERGTDDLKCIRGIGVLIEKKLNAMGVRTYAQVANWTAADVSRVSQSLDFKGRIERENWIEQARILSSGGQTEFSRRSSSS